MKKLTRQIICACLSVVMLIMCAATTFAEPTATNNAVVTTSGEVGADFTKQLSNDNYELYYKAATAEIAVKDLKSGTVFYSNPQDREATIGSTTTQAYKNTSSQIIAYYYDELTVVAVDSYTQSASLNQVKSQVTDNKLVVDYHFGLTEFKVEMLPPVISRERMEKDILSKLEESEKDYILARYALYSRDELDADTLSKMKVSYPALADHDIYALTVKTKFICERIYGYFQKAGYTHEDLQRDCDENQVENLYEPPVSFDFQVEYSLNNDGFTARLNTQKTVYDKEYPPIRVDFLPYFEASNNTKQGYIFVPDGEGALINFNNKKITADQYWKRFFANDSAINAVELAAQSEYSVLPVFGSSDEDSGYFASVDVGYEHGGVVADISGKNHPYNFVSGFFDVVPFDKVSISGKNTADDTSVKYAPSPVSCGIEVSYHLYSKHIEYDEMAIGYRNHLKNIGVLTKTAQDDSTFNAEFIATARVKKNFLGFLYNKLEGLMTYKEAAQVIDELGLDGVDINYVNAVNGGKQQEAITKISPEKVLGSKNDRLALDDKVNDFAYSFNLRTGKDVPKSKASFTLSKEIAKVYEYDFISKYFNRRKYSVLLAPKFIDKQIKSIPKSLKKQNITAVNLADIAIKVDSDFNLRNYTERYEARLKIQDFLKALDENTTVSVDYGSVYALPYIDKIYDMPTTSSQYSLIDTDVPFYPIVVRGSVAYVTDSINTADDSVTAFLESVEIGAQIQYSWVYRNEEDLVDIYENYYNCIYSNSIEQAKDFGAQIKDLFAKIGQSEITAHKSISATLKQTDFASGHTVYVNYGKEPVTIGNNTVNPESFLCVETANS